MCLDPQVFENNSEELMVFSGEKKIHKLTRKWSNVRKLKITGGTSFSLPPSLFGFHVLCSYGVLRVKRENSTYHTIWQKTLCMMMVLFLGKYTICTKYFLLPSVSICQDVAHPVGKTIGVKKKQMEVSCMFCVSFPRFWPIFSEVTFWNPLPTSSHISPGDIL